MNDQHTISDTLLVPTVAKMETVALRYTCDLCDRLFDEHNLHCVLGIEGWKTFDMCDDCYRAYAMGFRDGIRVIESKIDEILLKDPLPIYGGSEDD